jgi:ribosomal protein S18 acetylase RimI-like enzyme
MLEIRRFKAEDKVQIWKILHDIIKRGDSFAYPVDSSEKEMIDYWCGADKHTYVATENDEVVATFFMKDNQPGLGSHIANAGYAVSMKHGGKGIGQAIGEFSLEEARRLGYQAMQFNIVVKSNVNAVKLWTKLGFKIIGEIPDAFNHPQHGMTNAYIMYQKL